MVFKERLGDLAIARSVSVFSPIRPHMQDRVWTKIERAYSRSRVRWKGIQLNVAALVGGKRRVLCHGLQRSGTNYLLLWLHWNGVAVINGVDPRRDDPRHKHCRWQHDKSTLIEPIRADYGNSFTVNDIDEMDAICDLSDRPVHIVLSKERIPWLASIANWGLNVGWFDQKSMSLSALGCLATDYDAYTAFWQAMAAQHEDRVMLITYNELMEETGKLQARLETYGLASHGGDEDFSVNEVPRSPTNRAVVVNESDVISALREGQHGR